MKRFDPPDCFHIDAAEGWLGLGDYASASCELDKVSQKRQKRPRVLELRWQISAANQDWEACLQIASAVVRAAPKRPSGWIYRSKALFALKRVREARDNLREAHDRDVAAYSVFLYDLARYECLLGNLDSAIRWFELIPVTRRTEYEDMALCDPDYKLLWSHISENQIPF